MIQSRRAWTRGLSTSWALSPLATCLLLSCETAEVKPVPPPVVRTHYTLRLETPQVYSEPLPKRTDITVVWHYSDGHSEEIPGFHAWDLLGEGRYSMVEVLDDHGEVSDYLYDFDGDGEIDLTVP